MKNWIIIGGVVLLVVFLVSFVPPYIKASRLGGELSDARQEINMAQLRDLVAVTYFQTVQKNYGIASSTSTRFFNRIREVAGQVPDANRRKALEDLASFRDKVTAGLAKGDPGVLNELQTLFIKTRQATGTPD